MSKKLLCLIYFILVLCLVETSTDGNIDPGLVGWWTFDDGSGTVAKDLSGNGVDATFFGEPTWGKEAVRGGILLFDGTTAAPEYVLMDGSYQVPVYTITLWFRVKDGSGQRDIFSAYAPGVQHGILLELGGDGTLRYLHRYPLGTGGGTNIYTTTTYGDGAWYHAAMVKSVDTIKLYINGEEIGSAADSSKFNPGDAFGVVLGILDHERAPDRLFPGAIDDVRIYDRPMSQEEIQSVMQAEPWPYAWGPIPADGALHPDTWVNLGWLPGPFAVSHDVYFGDSFDDVNDGAEGTFQGNQTATFLVAGFPGFAFPGGLVPGTMYYWRIDEVNKLNPNSPWKGDVWSFLVPPKKAYKPAPVLGARFIDPSVTLTWTAGYGAKLHTVYFGDNFDDVNNATGGLPKGAATYTPDPLELGKTYYWRVDEFDGVTTYRGDVWSFTTAGPGGGLRADYFKGRNLMNRALTRIDPQINFNWSGAPDEAVGQDNFSVRWTGEVEAAFTETYTFYTNSDDGVRLWVDGQQLVDNWTVHTNTENSGNINLAAGQTYSVVMEYYDNEGVAVAELRWSSPRTPKQLIPQAALSLPVRASRSKPSNGAVDVKQTQILSWSPGDYAASHQVYFGTDEDAVKNADTSSPEYKGSRNLGSESYDPGKLQWDTTYYWRVDEVNNVNPDSPWVGNLWSFTTANFLIVDDFEDYDIGNNEIWWSWKDGLGYAAHGNEPACPGNGTGSMVGDETTGSYCEETIVHGGSQSMPLFYDNSILRYSEAEKTLTYPRDWTENGVSTLSIWFRGIADNAAETLYVALNGNAIVTNDNPNAAQIGTWTAWNIDLQAFADQGVNLANVNTLALRLGNKKNPQAGGSGTMYFDDIRLYRPAEQEPAP
ncbi:MAG: PA14 domain-containing protein [Sedimentisphaerales bacterium]